jgi:dTDP-4-amino-4,6-dideoxygalactose transaminase
MTPPLALLGGAPVFSEPFPRPRTTGGREVDAARAVVEAGVLSDFVGGPGPSFMGGLEVRGLEAEWAAAFGTRHAVSVSSATSGLHAALVAAGVGPGDEVIVPPQTMSATATAVVMAGAEPVFVDQLPRTGCLDPAAVAAAIGPRTAAIVAVNLFGGPAPLTELRALADEAGLFLLEDNAQGAGGLHAGRPLGTIGHAGVFSLNFHKTIQCGEGGVVVTDDDRVARRLALVRNHGENAIESGGHPEDDDIVGYNYRLTEIQAAIARVQLGRLPELLEPRLATAAALDAALAGLPGLAPAAVGPGDLHVYYVYPLWFDARAAGVSRDLFVAALRAEGCPVVGGYVRPLYHLPLFRRLRAEGRAHVGGSRRSVAARVCPTAERAHGEELLYTTLVQHPFSRDAVGRFVRAVEKVLAHAPALVDGVRHMKKEAA